MHSYTKLGVNIFQIIRATARLGNPGEHSHQATKTLVHIEVIKVGYEIIFVLIKILSSLGSTFKMTTPSINHVTNTMSVPAQP